MRLLFDLRCHHGRFDCPITLALIGMTGTPHPMASRLTAASPAFQSELNQSRLFVLAQLTQACGGEWRRVALLSFSVIYTKIASFVRTNSLLLFLWASRRRTAERDQVNAISRAPGAETLSHVDIDAVGKKQTCRSRNRERSPSWDTDPSVSNVTFSTQRLLIVEIGVLCSPHAWGSSAVAWAECHPERALHLL